MNRDDVICMAREAGMVYREFEDEFANANTDGVDLQTISRFAQLVAAAEQKKWEEQTQVEINEAIIDEREACAKVCETEWSYHEEERAGKMFAEEIRARGHQ